MGKILYGQVHLRADFDEILRLKGTQTRIARKGKEWFLLAANFRVIGIGDSAAAMRARYQDKRHFGAALRLHNIESANDGRCSKAKCKAIFHSLVKEILG